MKLCSALGLFALLLALTGCHPANPLIGSWTSTTPATAYGAAGCPTHYVFTSGAQTSTSAGQDTTIEVTYNVQPGLVFVVMQTGSNGFKFPTPDTAAWTMFGCTYKRD